MTFGSCDKCHSTWNHVQYRIVNVTQSHGMFALCVPCWNDSSVEERVRHYLALYDEWGQEARARYAREDVIHAVRTASEGCAISCTNERSPS